MSLLNLKLAFSKPIILIVPTDFQVVLPAEMQGNDSLLQFVEVFRHDILTA